MHFRSSSCRRRWRSCAGDSKNGGTDTPETIAKRVAKAEEEITYAPLFDKIVVNDSLETAIADATRITESFIG